MLGTMVKFASLTIKEGIKEWERRIQENESGVADMRIDEDLRTIARQIL